MKKLTGSFYNKWEKKYDDNKFPIYFYIDHIATLHQAQNPNDFKKELLALLHWKDGHAAKYVEGESHAKPNTIDPIINLHGKELIEFKKVFFKVAGC